MSNSDQSVTCIMAVSGCLKIFIRSALLLTVYRLNPANLMKSLQKVLIFILTSPLVLSASSQLLSAQTIQEDRKVGIFEKITVSASSNTYVHVSYDKSHRIIVKADGRQIHKVKTVVSGETLNVYLNPEEVGNAKIEIYIRVPRIKKVTLTGSGRVEVIDGLLPGELQATAVSWVERFKRRNQFNNFIT